MKIAIRRALISVYDKTGLDELARGLHEAGVEIVSTGSTAATIRAAGVPVTAVEDVTGFPEILGGRVKTLHPHIHGGLLADQSDPSHVETIERHGIAAFQLLVSNLYPFAATVASGAAQPEVIEQIDIGGPAMVRAGAKNHGSVAVVTNPSRYPEVLAAVREGGFDLAARQRLALEAFRHTAGYDIGVASWLGNVVVPDGDGFPGWVAAEYERAAVLRYGENPHQQAALYVDGGSDGVAHAEQLSGKEMSYNNYVDADAAWRAAHDFTEPCVAIIKHANPCGIAVGADIAEAHAKAHACDPTSAYGGVVATNRPVTMAMADQLGPIFTEVVVAPSYEDGVLDRWAKKKDLRVLVASPRPDGPGIQRRPISGGLLLQTEDAIDAPGDDPATWTLQAGAAADAATLADLAFAWRAIRAVKSNAILLASGGATVGVGMGQVNRVDSCKLAVARAGERARGSVAASDAFFPFADGAQVLIDAGVRAIVEPGGSIRDEDTVAACKD
ncbi:MAG TPA: bifunctional phosphoribosylaminoimidazolecarboxamide formyltransferase/IMP cyclohydrolase, partial [Jatrophihabitans sp.]|nr:bifunctional phosphoribosylaminoimidazolecarboxamide formyltransferase/IMP cyclohydrolase [Jatrophihabitans sp.]